MDSSNRLFRFSKPSWLHTPPARTFGVYTSGALFSLAFFVFIDAAAYSHSALNGSKVHIKFIDWVPGICSALGMLVINLIEKSRLSADSYSYNGSGVAWKARLVLFLGFALLAGGVAGSVVRACFDRTCPKRRPSTNDNFLSRLCWCLSTSSITIPSLPYTSVLRTLLRMVLSC